MFSIGNLYFGVIDYIEVFFFFSFGFKCKGIIFRVNFREVKIFNFERWN